VQCLCEPHVFTPIIISPVNDRKRNMFFAQSDIFTRCMSTRAGIKNVTNSKQTVKVPRVMYVIYFEVLIPVDVL